MSCFVRSIKQAAWHSFAVAANGTAYSISTAQPTMLAVTGGAQIPLFAYAQNLALSPDASALYMTVGGVCVMRLTGNGLRQELVAGQCPGQQLQPSLQQLDGPGTDYSSCLAACNTLKKSNLSPMLRAGKQARFVGIGALRVTNTVVMAIDSGAPRFILINSQAAVFTPPDLPRSSGDAYALADVVSVGGCALAVAGGNTTLYLIGPTGGVSSSASVVGYDATAIELFDYSSRSELWVFLLSSAGALMRVGVRYDSTRGQLLPTRDSAVVFKWNSNGFLFPAVDGLRMVQPSASNQMVVVDTASELHSVVALQPCNCHSGLSFQSAFPLGDFNTGVCVQPPAGTYVDGVGGLSICASCLDKLAALCPRGTVLRGVVCAWSPLLSGSSSSSVAPAIAVEVLSDVPAVAASGQLDVVAPFSDMGLNDAVSSGGDFDVHFEVRLASADATTIAYTQVMLEAESLWQLTLSPPATRNPPPAFDYIQEHSPWTSTSAARGVLGRNEGSLGQLWKRSPSLTGPPNALTPRLPGIWTACSAAVGHDQPCTCVIQPRATLPASWEAARNRIWPRVSPDAFYVTRTDSLANPIFVSSALRETIVEVASPQYAIGTFADLFQPAVCVFGWPATYSCPERMEWASPSEDWPAGQCVPSGIGFLAASDAVGLYCVDAVPFKVHHICFLGLDLCFPLNALYSPSRKTGQRFVAALLHPLPSWSYRGQRRMRGVSSWHVRIDPRQLHAQKRIDVPLPVLYAGGHGAGCRGRVCAVPAGNVLWACIHGLGGAPLHSPGSTPRVSPKHAKACII